ncbi:hypothetical protein D3C87_2080120 [compost metagenome]
MSGSDVQRTFIWIGVLAGNGFDRVHFRQNFTRDADDFLACWGNLSKVLSAASENLDTQLILQHAHLLADTGL